MYGTVARTRVKPENRAKLREVFEQQSYVNVPGYVTSYVLWQNDGDAAWMFAVFEDRESYEKNAGDPAQNERYLEYRALMEEEPEWHDGEIEKA
ncbi:MAG TPA: antibiotic biosynthesis monooxygenase [Actinomycetota bacterium]|nr:antibiotic biosynthesis monooxygenase [Actinomycetota bacterium]